MATVDLSTPPNGHDLTIKPTEDAADKAARLAQEAADSQLRRLKDTWLFFAAMLGTGIVFVGCAYMAFFRTDGQPEDRKWAMSSVSAILAGLIGYLVKGAK